MKRITSFLIALLCLLTVSCKEKNDPVQQTDTERTQESETAEPLSGETDPQTEPATDIATEPPTETSVTDNGDYFRKMVVFGDSIAHGYGLDDKLNTRYSALLTDRFSSLSVPLTETNYSVDGATSEDLLNLLNNGVSDLKDADLVIISIGANNILQYSYQFLGLLQNNVPEGALAIIISDEFQNNLSSGISRLGTDIPKIIEKIHEYAPDAVIVFQTIYNPYQGAVIPIRGAGFERGFDIGITVNEWVEKLNKEIRKGAEQYGYIVAEVHDEFENNPERLVNVILTENGFLTADLDPHPNADGHKVIADVILETLKDSGKKLPE